MTRVYIHASLPRITRLSRSLIVVAGVALVAAALAGLSRIADPEQRDLDESGRADASGQFVRLTDGYTHYELAGPAGGRAVVLAPGFSVPYYVWDPTFAALASRGFRVLRYDYYGRGYSDRPDVAYSQDLYLRQLTELLEAVSMQGPVDLAGVSLGASVITAMADRQPDRVRSLVYVDPSFRHSYTPGTTAGMPRVWNFLTAMLDERGWADEQLADFVRPERFPDWPDRYRVQMRYRGFRRARLSEIVTNADVEQVPEVERVGRHARPVLLIWGKEDRTVPFSESAGLTKTMPKARLVAVEAAGHLPQLEQPDIVNAAIIEFLR